MKKKQSDIDNKNEEKKEETVIKLKAINVSHKKTIDNKINKITKKENNNDKKTQPDKINKNKEQLSPSLLNDNNIKKDNKHDRVRIFKKNTRINDSKDDKTKKEKKFNKNTKVLGYNFFTNRQKHLETDDSNIIKNIPVSIFVGTWNCEYFDFSKGEQIEKKRHTTSNLKKDESDDNNNNYNNSNKINKNTEKRSFRSITPILFCDPVKTSNQCVKTNNKIPNEKKESTIMEKEINPNEKKKSTIMENEINPNEKKENDINENEIKITKKKQNENEIQENNIDYINNDIHIDRKNYDYVFECNDNDNESWHKNYTSDASIKSAEFNVDNSYKMNIIVADAEDEKEYEKENEKNNVNEKDKNKLGYNINKTIIQNEIKDIKKKKIHKSPFSIWIQPYHDIYIISLQESISDNIIQNLSIYLKEVNQETYVFLPLADYKLSGYGDGAFLQTKSTTISAWVKKTKLYPNGPIKLCASKSIAFNKLNNSKGCVSILFNIFNQYVLFIGCHLPAKHEELREKSTEFVLNKLSEYYSNKSTSNYEHVFHHIIWTGDFNFRVSGISINDVIKHLKQKNIQELLKYDEHKSNASSNILQNFQEQPIKFIPTYKKIEGRQGINMDDPNWVEKEYKLIHNIKWYKGGKNEPRIPSWTDRIFKWSSEQTKNCLNFVPDSYISATPEERNILLFSDHSPVSCSFNMYKMKNDKDIPERKNIWKF